MPQLRITVTSMLTFCCRDVTIDATQVSVFEGVEMSFNFDWNYVSSGAPYVTISEFGLSFNAPAVSLLNNPEQVLVGFDNSAMTIGVKKYQGETNVRPYMFYSRMKQGWVRIGCKDFVRYLSSLTDISFAPAKKYLAKFDIQEKILYVSIKNTGKAEYDKRLNE